MFFRLAWVCGSVLLPSFCFAQTGDDLPRVLILGDSVYQQPAREIQKAMKGKAVIVFPAISPGEIRNSRFALENFDKLVGNKKWDVIHFNFGLGDLISRKPGIKDFRVIPFKAGGIRATTQADYAANLQRFVSRLKRTEAKLIWANTTPIRHSTSGVFEKGSEVEYNKIAEKVMRQHKVSINNMHAHVKSLIDMDRPAAHGADPFHFDRKSIAEPILTSIQKAIE